MDALEIIKIIAELGGTLGALETLYRLASKLKKGWKYEISDFSSPTF
jgi:hypothetical protein